MVFRLACGTLAFLGIADAYVWPSPQLDALEAVRFDQLGFNTLSATTLASFIQPCDQFTFPPSSNSGRSNAADWIRTAYHDAATHNSTDGTGGMDGSIRLQAEHARAEMRMPSLSGPSSPLRIGKLGYFELLRSSHLRLKYSGGPEIAFRGGRLDAAVPNAPGVPVPEQGLASHIASFARQGFTQTEMIGLVACGHTFGGVQHSFFPDIVNVLIDPTSTEDVAHFDSTFVTFDNNVAAEYISGTTKSPLVVGFNDTTNSDKRIFGSDGNVTMLSFANSPELFTSTCANLFARMLDTVPSGVELTDVITPLPVKPSVNLIMNGDTLQLSGLVRLWNTTEDPTRTVRVLWHDHVGGTGNGTANFLDTSSSTGGKYTATWYGFNSTVFSFHPLLLDPVAGVTSLSFLVDGNLEDQGGLGFAIQDGFMLSQTSCQGGAPVRNGVNPSRVYLEQINIDSVQRRSITENDITPPSQPVAANSAYSLWSMNLCQSFEHS
ncbi:heme peroxidase [Mycena pura]|uniref:Peroxidase n=1 Tax=Mycena pura TaxID=153505 RepID=A0AAD6USL1_9AGAR|nr:heme peroxidase [Mycena pura]